MIPGVVGRGGPAGHGRPTNITIEGGAENLRCSSTWVGALLCFLFFSLGPLFPKAAFAFGECPCVVVRDEGVPKALGMAAQGATCAMPII